MAARIEKVKTLKGFDWGYCLSDDLQVDMRCSAIENEYRKLVKSVVRHPLYTQDMSVRLAAVIQEVTGGRTRFTEWLYKAAGL